MKYRYTVRRSDWTDTGVAWWKFRDYAKVSFSHVVKPNDEVIYFNATPQQVRQAVATLGISTIGFNILTTSELEPSTHEE